MIWHPELSNIQIPLSSIDESCTIHSHVWIGKNVKIGLRVRIEAHSFLPEGITIEDDCFIGPHVVFTNDKYPPGPKEGWLLTVVKRGASIGANCTIVCGATIGEGAMVGAGSVVTRDIPAGELWYGNPARKRGSAHRA